jgi:hypothetical protein
LLLSLTAMYGRQQSLLVPAWKEGGRWKVRTGMTSARWRAFNQMKGWLSLKLLPQH